MANRILLSACLGTLCAVAHGSAFLGRQPENASEPASLLDELEKVIGKHIRLFTEGRVLKLEELLRPTFQALPKGPDDTVGPEAVRYSLHRLFVDRHGWYVNGLHSAGESFNSSSPSALFQKHVGDELHDVFEERLVTQGFDLHRIAVMAATLEALVRNETLARMKKAYEAIDVSQTEEISEEQDLQAIDTYMMIWVLGIGLERITPESVKKMQRVIYKAYPTWDRTKQFVREVRARVLNEQGILAATSFNATERVLEEIEERYGRWQNRECEQLKESLVQLEEPGTGRVRIEKFYQSALDGNWQFSENTDYLRLLGALDDFDPNRLSVIIPNYINAHSNCVASSRLYSVCCIDECQPLMKHIETEVAHPVASPARIAEIVASIPSASVKAPRIMPASLTQRLEDIASHHGGFVPLHGRLFMQWMHHAYPLECSYPHISGTTRTIRGREWTKQTNRTFKASKETMQWHIGQAENLNSIEQAELPWLHVEELHVSRPELMVAYQPRNSSSFRTVMLSVAILAMAWALAKNVINAAADMKATPKKNARYMV